MKKLIILLLILHCVIGLIGCSHKEPSVVINTYYAASDADVEQEKEEYLILYTHYEMSDGTWKTDENTYQYRLEITGRMGNATQDNTFIFLSNIEDITFEQAWKAAGFSSNMNDYFEPEVAKFVAIKY